MYQLTDPTTHSIVRISDTIGMSVLNAGPASQPPHAVNDGHQDNHDSGDDEQHATGVTVVCGAARLPGRPAFCETGVDGRALMACRDYSGSREAVCAVQHSRRRDGTRSMSLHVRTSARSLFACASSSSSQAPSAQEVFRYRDFQLGSDVASVAKLTGSSSSGAKTIHTRPAVMQDLEWRPRYYGGGAPQTDPVDLMLFRFYDDQLFMVVVNYDRRRTEGMSPADMIAAVSATYGPVSQVPSRRLGTPTVQYGFPDTPLAVWGNAEVLGHAVARPLPGVFPAGGRVDATREPCSYGERCSGAVG